MSSYPASPLPYAGFGPWSAESDPARLDEKATDRAAGVLLGAGAGDALGVPYEFRPSMNDDRFPEMKGGGPFNFAPGEYSDDTQMHVCIAEVAATGADLRTPEALDAIAMNFLRWYGSGPADVGNQTRSVLGTTMRAKGTSPSEAMLAVSRRHAAAHPKSSAGNGSLMRTGIVALAYLDDATAMAEAARLVSELTHADPDCAEACILWCSGIRTAVLTGTFEGVREGLDLLPEERRAVWAARLDTAEAHPPRHFRRNGWVVEALQAAWSAITRTPVPKDLPEQGSFAAQHLQLALEAAVRAGNDTDTVAAIAGSLLGARWGSSAVPLAWQNKVHGWPTNSSTDLIRLAVLTARTGQDDRDGWPSAPRVTTPVSSGKAFTVRHPHDPDLILGNLALTEHPGPAPVDAVVSLCRVGSDPILTTTDVQHVRVWLVDKSGTNSHLHFTLDQAAREVLRLRQEGKRVLLHCVAGRSRTPAVAAVYSHLVYGVAPLDALREVNHALSGYWTLPNHPEMLDAVFELAGEESQRDAFSVRRRSRWRKLIHRR
ncbi:ADP-ribosylglycohydrolase family protein [Streptomyces sp. OfavH-34-F]|uniref:ADP-ribosylglycohydrolase family protein n=1 Tax=Streptomyces sp. OfavH-34-F TaxID=2917760 RepID=UPI001EF3404A|nr:ADP-ribosylglycohydrolase family protein [Streptomyces sp. OfavH-34-F]MCG7524011.1 ADP-ribosylglycohydrolase family protein [Streptomyces sp. OfavH-34-F]